MKIRLFLASALGLAIGQSALAQSSDYMQEDCANLAQIFFQDFQAKTETSYEGQRTDGSHAVNGTIFLETHSEDLQCSYNGAGDTLIDFVAEGQSWPAFVRGDGSPHQSGQSTSSAAAGSSGHSAADDAADVKFAPGTSGITLQGAIRGQEYFDYKLTANADQTMHVELRVRDTNGDGTIYFNILPPGSSGEAIHIGSMDGDIAEMRLTQSGAYVIRLYLMGNDRDTDKTVGYDLDVSIR